MLPRIVHAHQGIGRTPTSHTCWLVWGEDGLSWLRRPLLHVPKIIGNMLITCILSVIGLATSNGVGLTAEIQKHLLNKEIQMIPPLTESQRIGIPSKSVARRSLEQSTASYQQFTIYTDELCEDVDAIASIAGSLLPGCQAFDDGTSAAAACSAEQFEDSLDISYFYYDSSDCSGEPGYMYDLHLPANCSGSTPAGSTYSKVSCVTGDAPWNDDKEGFISM